MADFLSTNDLLHGRYRQIGKEQMVIGIADDPHASSSESWQKALIAAQGDARTKALKQAEAVGAPYVFVTGHAPTHFKPYLSVTSPQYFGCTLTFEIYYPEDSKPALVT